MTKSLAVLVFGTSAVLPALGSQRERVDDWRKNGPDEDEEDGPENWSPVIPVTIRAGTNGQASSPGAPIKEQRARFLNPDDKEAVRREFRAKMNKDRMARIAAESRKSEFMARKAAESRKRGV